MTDDLNQGYNLVSTQKLEERSILQVRKGMLRTYIDNGLWKCRHFYNDEQKAISQNAQIRTYLLTFET